MRKLALIHIESGEVISTCEEGVGGIDLPGAGRVSPPVAGWEGGGELVTTEGPPRYRLLPVEPLEVPEGKRIVPGTTAMAVEKGAVVQTAEFEDIPPPPSEEQRVSAALRMLGFESAAEFTAAVSRMAEAESKKGKV